MIICVVESRFFTRISGLVRFIACTTPWCCWRNMATRSNYMLLTITIVHGQIISIL